MRALFCLGCWWLLTGLGFQTGIPPGEGRPQFVTNSDTLRFYGGPTKNSQVVHTAKVTKGGRIAADSHLVISKSSPLMDYSRKEKKKIEAECYGIDVTHLTADDYYGKSSPVTYEDITQTKATLLMYRAEGTYFARLDENLCILDEDELGDYTTPPSYEWWIRVLYHRTDKKYGWILVGEGVEESSRKF